jgi:hypothetical protein
VRVQCHPYSLILLTAVIIYYSDDIHDVRQAYWTQMTVVYSMFVGTIAALVQQKLTLHDFTMIVQLIGSPSLCYMGYCAIQSLRRSTHGLPILMSQRYDRYVTTTLIANVVWVIFCMLSLDPGHIMPFSQKSCSRPYVWISLLNPLYHPFAPIISLALIPWTAGPFIGSMYPGITMAGSFAIIIHRNRARRSDLAWWKWPRVVWYAPNVDTYT